MKQVGIYKITNLINGKVYIGQSLDIHTRWNTHKNKNTWGKNQAIYKAFKKYGIENFEFSIIELCDEKELNEKEIFYIELYDSFNKGYNMTLGGKSVCGYQHTEETKKKLSENRKGKYTGINNPRYGIKHTEESKKKMSIHSKGKNKNIPRSEEVKQKISKTKMNHKHTEETKNKISKTRKN